VTSQFVTARVRITIWPKDAIPADIEDYAGDAVSIIVDVRGETFKDILVPYKSPYAYQPCRGYIHPEGEDGWALMPPEELNQFVTLSVINVMVQPDFAGTALIYTNVFMAAAENFTFGGLTTPYQRDILASPPSVMEEEVVPQSLEIAFARPFQPLIEAKSSIEEGAVLPEQFHTVEGILAKYVSASAFASIANVYLPVTDLQIGNTLDANPYTDAIEFWRKVFRWHRGAIRFKLVPTPATDAQLAADPTRRYVSMVLIPIEPGPTVGPPAWVTTCDTKQRAVLEFEVPWLYNAAVCSNWCFGCAIDDPCNTLTYDSVLFSGSIVPAGAVTCSIFRSVGEDFSFGHLLPMPFIADVFPPPAAKKVIPDDKGKAKIVKETTLDQSVGAALTKAQLLDSFYERMEKMRNSKSSQSSVSAPRV